MGTRTVSLVTLTKSARTLNGIATLVKIPYPYRDWTSVHAWPYGEVVYDVDVSPDGELLSASVGDASGRQSLRVMSTRALAGGDATAVASFDFGSAIPSNFVFSPDGRYLFGSSYYTGVSNVFRFEIATHALEAVSNADGTYSSRALDGTRITSTLGPDPRWGMLSPLTANAQLQTPDGLSLTMASTRTATLSTPGDPFSLVALTDTLKMNNRTYTGTYNSAARTWTITTPAGRQSTMLLDDQGRLVQRQMPGLAPLRHDYDNRGRVISVTQGLSPTARVSTFAYGADGFTSAITSSISRSSATRSATFRESPVSITVRSPASRSRRTPSRASLRTASSMRMSPTGSSA